MIAGDLFPSKGNESKFIAGDINAIFDQRIIDLFKSADFSVCNLEGTLTESQRKTQKLGPNIKADPRVLSAYKNLGITLFATANNHINDYCQKGYIDTQEALLKYGFESIGSGANIEQIIKFKNLELEGKKVCIYNVAETMFNIPTATNAGVHLYDEYLVCKEIEQLKRINEYVIVLYHGGVEYFPYPTLELRKRFHRMADCGADVILAQHTHCIGCEEYYNGAYLLYGQGNFLFVRGDGKECTRHGLAIEIAVSDMGLEIYKHPVLVNGHSISYDNSFEYSDFNERCTHVNDDEYINAKFFEFVQTQRSVKTKQFVKHHWYDKILYKILPKSIVKKFNEKFRTVSFTTPELMRILYTIRSEQQRDTALYLVLRELEKRGVNWNNNCK